MKTNLNMNFNYKNSLATNVEMADKMNQNNHMNMKVTGCIEEFSFLNKVYANKDEHELELETFLQHCTMG